MHKKLTPYLILFLSLFLVTTGISAQGLTVNMSMTPACDHDGTATANVVNGTGPYTYIWYYNNGQDTTTTNSISGLAGGWLGVNVTDANGLTGWGNINVTPPFTFTLTTTPDTCNMGTGTATVNLTGGTAPFTYLWDNLQTTQTATGLSHGSVEVSVTDANGCNLLFSETDSGFAQIPNWSPITTTSTSTPSVCNDGTATITASNGTAPYTYFWQTTPVQTTQTATGLPPGWAVVQVTDAAGCSTSRWVNVLQGVSPISLTMTTTPETCVLQNGTAAIVASGGTPPYSYLWSNGATTSSISGLSRGWYSVTVTDAAGCPNSKSDGVGLFSPVTLSLSKVDPTCNNSDGTATANPAGGTTPYTYLWNDGQTTQTATGLAPGYHGVTITDANGCTEYRWVQLSYPSSCFVTIAGKVWNDQNGNCVADPADRGMANVIVDISPAGYSRTDGNGNYSVQELPGTYTLTQNVPNYFAQNCPASPATYTVNLPTAGGFSLANDFWNQPVGTVSDLRTSLYCGLARPGRSQTVQIRYWNEGNTALNSTITYVHDAGHTFTSSAPIASTYNSGTNTATFSLGTLYPGDDGIITIHMGVPTTATVGSVLSDSVSITPMATDSTPANNTQVCDRTVTASYDPNQKLVNFGALIATTDNPFHYTIEFQNTGNDTAFTVELRDTLSSNLDVRTFVEGNSSHPYTVSLTGQGELTFRFDNILLPDSNINEPASHGFVSFYVDQKPNLAPGTEIENTAAIYFDYNAPVITNTTLNTLEEPTSVNPNLNTLENQLQLYPNPSRTQANIEYSLQKEANVTLEVFDMRGVRVLNVNKGRMFQGTHTETINVSQLGAGMYTVKALIDGQVLIQKMVVNK